MKITRSAAAFPILPISPMVRAFGSYLEFPKRIAGSVVTLGSRVTDSVLRVVPDRRDGWSLSSAYSWFGQKETEMFRSKATEDGRNGVANGAEIIGGKAPPQRSAADQPAARAEPTPVSCIGAGMSIVGNVECSGSAQLFGRIEGEVRASDLMIGEGAQVEGSVIAQEVTVSGRVKGTIRAVRVTLRGGTVEGDIFNRSLSIDENSVFEGASRRDEDPTERRREAATESSSSIALRGPQKKDVQSPPLVPSTLPCIDTIVQEH